MHHPVYPYMRVQEDILPFIGSHQPYSNGMTHSQMLGKFEYTGGPIFKVVLEC